MLQNHQCSNNNSLVKRRVMPDKCSHKTGRKTKKSSVLKLRLVVLDFMMMMAMNVAKQQS